MTKKLGASFNPDTGEVQFNVFSKNATCIKIFFYKSHLGEDEVFSKTLSVHNDIWSITFSSRELIESGVLSKHIFYGYRAWGPNWVYSDDWKKGSEIGFLCDVDSEGNRFNPNKLLIDPYAKELSHDPQIAQNYMDPNACIDDYYGGKFRCIDTGRIAPKSIFMMENDATDFGKKPERLLKDDVIYEVNLRGFTMLDDTIPENERGTYKGAAKKAAYLKELGVTAVEFLPVQEFADEQNDDDDPRGDNYWGYMTINYFSPNRRYSSDKSPGGPTREFKEMVRAFHDEGIKVIMDVVYNHTGEGTLKRIINQGNPSTAKEIEKAIREANPSRGMDELQDVNAACILSYAGLDNRSYYYLRDGNSRYEGRGGCGGNLNYDNDVVKNLIIDSLKYWKDEMGVDGFRFDLAPVLNLKCSDGKFLPDESSAIFKKISKELPSRSISLDGGADLIAEPWGDGTCIEWAGKFPEDWSVWNMYYRDTIKTSMNKYGIININIGEISKAVSGSKERIGKKPWNSINYIVSHDDCNSMRNLFSYNSFFHLDEAEIRSDQLSWNQGGDIEAQKKAVRTAFALLMLSAGVPMFAGGDELFRGIPPYNNEIGRMNLVSCDRPDFYIDFGKYETLTLFHFVKSLIHFRNKHESLRPYHYFKGEVIQGNGLKDIAWYKEDGGELSGADWDGCDFLAYRINSQFENLKDERDRICSIYVAYNRCPTDKKILLPENIQGRKWCKVFDTHNSFAGYADKNGLYGNTECIAHNRSVLVFAEI